MIAVTGANGLLGSAVIRKLIHHDQPFIAIRRTGSDLSLLHDIESKINWREADILDTVSLSDAFKDVTHVIHTAAVLSFNPKHASRVMDINVQGTRNVVNTCIAQGIGRLLHVSSVAALGRQKGQTFISETNKWVDSPLNSVYSKSKYLAELEIFRGQEEGISTVTINPSIILAAGNWNNSSAQLFKYVWDEKPFYFDGSVNYVDVLDLSDLIYTLLFSSIEGERFIASAGKITYKVFFDRLAAAFNKKGPSIRLGKNLLRIGAFFEGIRSRLAGNEPRLTRETARLAGAEFTFENQKIRNCLDFEFRPLDETVQRCCQYYTDKMKSKKLPERS